MNISDLDLKKYKPVPILSQIRGTLLKRIKNNEDLLPEIQGREEAKKDVARALLSGYNIYLVSEEGTGKTRLAKSLTGLLDPVPKIKGCPYNDDPSWPKHLLCAKCGKSKNPAEEYGVEIITGSKRFSRIQGNDYTDEAKLLGLKDIHAIAQGKSPTDMESFAATGVFRANRGILFIDELPAVRTKVQVLLHPIAEEKMAVLEEYHLEHPLDILLVATGNPQGFSHVNEVPRPLLDRFELIYMPLPSREVELEIALNEKFEPGKNTYSKKEEKKISLPPLNDEDIQRTAVLPWWIMYLLNEAIACSRKCDVLDRKPSIRGTCRVFDHTYASVELANKKVASLKEALDGMKLALRGRIELKPDLIDFDNPAESFSRLDEFSQDILAVASGNLAGIFLDGCNKEKLSHELNQLAAESIKNITSQLEQYPELKHAVARLKSSSGNKIKSSLLNKTENQIITAPQTQDKKTLEQYDYSAVEVIYNAALHKGLVKNDKAEQTVFVPKPASWTGASL